MAKRTRKRNPNPQPAYRKHSGRDVAVVTLTDAETGRRRSVYLGTHDTQASRRRYFDVLAAWEKAGRRIPDDIDAPETEEKELSVSEILLAYWREVDGTYSASEAGNIKRTISIVRKRFGLLPASAFGPKRLRELREHMIDLDWCRTNVNKQTRRVCSIFKWAASHELIEPATYQALATVQGLRRGRTRARETEPVGPAPDAHIESVRPFVSRQVWALIQLQLFTAARAGELVPLRPIDLETIGSVWTASPRAHKSSHLGKSRTIYFGPRAQEVLRDFLANRATDAHLFSPREAELERKAKGLPGMKGRTKASPRRANQAPNPKQTGRSVGAHYTTASYRRAIHRACELAGVPKWSPHQLRHAAATSIRREFGVEAAQVMLGHARAETAQIYAEANRERALDVAGRIG